MSSAEEKKEQRLREAGEGLIDAARRGNESGAEKWLKELRELDELQRGVDWQDEVSG